MATVDDLYAAVRDDIAAALAEPDHSMRMSLLRAAGDAIFRIAYDDIPGDPRGIERAVIDYLNVLNAAMVHTQPDGSPDQIERIAWMWAAAAANGAAFYSAPRARKRWVTREDDRVRELHVPLHGQTVGAGETFQVGGVRMRYPGEPVGPPEGWINCRCRLDIDSQLASGSPTGDADAASDAGADARPSGPGELVAADINGGDGMDPTEPTDECPEGQHPDPDTGECVPDTADDDEAPPFTKGKAPPFTKGKAPAFESGGTADGLVARTFDTSKRKAMADRGTAMPDGSFPISNVEDLRNAIQAIGRAKDPDKAKAHIRKRARALGAENLIPDSWTASAEGLTAWAPSTSPPGTHDAPGWITNPRETQRLRTYWTKGEGALKIRWGQPGDFDRCRKQLRKYVTNPEFLAGTCANLHFVALGFWPNQGPHAGKHGGNRGLPGSADDFTPDTEEFAAVSNAFLAAADLADELPPIEWFQAPPLTAATPVTITDDDEFIAHLAVWDTCHVGISSGCTTPPHSEHDYAYFRTGEVMTAGGPVPVGQITMDTGHAGTDLDPRETVSHYDNTGTVVADVAAGEDDYGIWMHGRLRPGVTPEQRHALRAGSLSGDWRRIAGNLELVAALVVNVPGFPIPRQQMAASAGIETALVAAAIVATDPNAVDIERIAIAVVDRLEARERKAANTARVAALRTALNADRVNQLVAAIGE